MLFNSFVFAFAFLPLALAGYFLVSAVSLRGSIVVLTAASVVFYAYSGWQYLPLLLGSILVNYLVGRAICAARATGRARAARHWLVLGLAIDLALLAFFKYANFMMDNLAALLGHAAHRLDIALPIGISFFTFTQIAYLVDCHAGTVRDTRKSSYALFVTYFPHLIAGPILHHKEMMPQFEDAQTHRFVRGRLVVGLAIFTVGLLKKVVFADGIAQFVAPVFDAGHADLTLVEAWCGALAYTFQLYFDFSAYSDMAFGLSYMAGVVLPVNFNSPYKATSVIDFWRRWHMTLSQFLRDYLYIPLGGSRRGPLRRYGNLLATMLLGGLWHGANWTFVVWGGLHGLYLAANHAIRHLAPAPPGPLRRAAGWCVTGVAVVVAWVFFRAPTLDAAHAVLAAMFGGAPFAPAGTSALQAARILPVASCAAWIGGLAAVCLWLPNVYDLCGRGRNARLETRLDGAAGGVVTGMLFVGVFLLLAISETRAVSEFLYFNF